MFCHGYIDENRPDTTVGPVGDLRISDADRNEVIDRLHRHASEGRLNLEEFEARVSEVYDARTGDELRNALRELPSLSPGGPGRWGRGWPRRRWFFPPVLVVVAIAVAVVVFTPAPFPLIPIAFWSAVAVMVLRHRRRWAHHHRRWEGSARVQHL